MMIIKLILALTILTNHQAQTLIQSSVVSIAFGHQDNHLGTRDEMISQEVTDDYGSFVEGPISFRVGDHHRFHFLDHFKQRLLTLDAKGKFQNSTPLPSFDDRELELVDFWILDPARILYLDSISQDLILSNYKDKTHTVVQTLKLKDQDLYFDGLQAYGSNEVYSLDRVSGALYKVYPGPMKKVIAASPEDSSFSVTNIMGRSDSVLAFQANESNPEMINFYQLEQKNDKAQANLLFKNAPMGNYSAIKILNANNKRLDALLVSQGEEKSIWDRYLVVGPSGNTLQNRKLGLNVIPWYMTRSFEFKAPFLYLLSPAEDKGIEVHRVNLSRLKPKS